MCDMPYKAAWGWGCKKGHSLPSKVRRIINMTGKNKYWYEAAAKYIRMMNLLKHWLGKGVYINLWQSKLMQHYSYATYISNQIAT